MTVVRFIGAAGAVLLLAVTAACGANAAEETPQAENVTITDPWVKAATTEDEMTSASGTLRNTSEEDARIVSVTTDVTERAELHEMTEDENGQMVMQRKENGIVVPAGQSQQLSPGGDHLMFLELPEDVAPGQEVTITLTFADDSTTSFTAQARSFAGAGESYDPGSDNEKDDTDAGAR